MQRLGLEPGTFRLQTIGSTAAPGPPFVNLLLWSINWILESPLPCSLISPYVYNTLQAVLFVSIRPLSKSLYRRINRFLAELLWLQLIWLVDWWAGVKVIRSIKLRNPKSVSLHFGKAQMHPSQLFKGKKKICNNIVLFIRLGYMAPHAGLLIGTLRQIHWLIV